jgi:hypothetical protein
MNTSDDCVSFFACTCDEEPCTGIHNSAVKKATKTVEENLNTNMRIYKDGALFILLLPFAKKIHKSQKFFKQP